MLQELDFDTQDEAIKKLEELYNKNKDCWEVLPITEPQTAEYGFYLFKYLNDGEPVKSNEFHRLSETEQENLTEEGIIIKWPMFDKKFNSDVMLLDNSDDIFEFLEKHPNAAVCDEPRTLKVGFVHYDTENHKSIVRQIRLGKIPKEKRLDMLNTRKTKMEDNINNTQSIIDIINIITGKAIVT